MRQHQTNNGWVNRVPLLSLEKFLLRTWRSAAHKGSVEGPIQLVGRPIALARLGRDSRHGSGLATQVIYKSYFSLKVKIKIVQSSDRGIKLLDGHVQVGIDHNCIKLAIG